MFCCSDIVSELLFFTFLSFLIYNFCPGLNFLVGFPTVISCKEFNSIAKICTGADNLFTPKSEENINIINEALDEILSIVRTKVTEDTRERIKNPILEILMHRTELSYPARLSEPYVKTMIENVWNAKCKNKYLKYKKKYLKLKKELNIK